MKKTFHSLLVAVLVPVLAQGCLLVSPVDDVKESPATAGAGGNAGGIGGSQGGGTGGDANADADAQPADETGADTSSGGGGAGGIGAGGEGGAGTAGVGGAGGELPDGMVADGYDEQLPDVARDVGPDQVVVPPGCLNNVQDGKETDIDCGGGVCPRCPVTRRCLLGSDCVDSVCFNNACRAARCDDEVVNGTESDVDCGGNCPSRCADGKNCNGGNDCAHSVCTTTTIPKPGGGFYSLCSPASCSDGVQNSDETDVDCGGTTCTKRCGDYKKCLAETDCTSRVCAAHAVFADGGAAPKSGDASTDAANDSSADATSADVSEDGGTVCQPVSCVDGVLNGTETDLDCGGTGCPGCATGKICKTGTDCAALVCTFGLCQGAQCGDAVKNGQETDVNCGGPDCPACPDSKACLLPRDCISKSCIGNVCEAPACPDGATNGKETDVDCGGPDCVRCGDGKTCAGNTDCLSGHCVGQVCQAPTCGDVIKNQDESDVDCGGTVCGPCDDTKACTGGVDCKSGVCMSKICQTGTCLDTVKNGNETDVDCGGSCTTKCAVGKACGQNSDCQNNSCVSALCQDPACNNLVLDTSNGETDVDCGGSVCKDCEDGQKCLIGGDCISLVCDTTVTPAVCKAPSCSDGAKNGTESDVDCGGPVGGCGRCGLGRRCAAASDCETGICTDAVCVAGSCNDKIQNGTETDVDCGGSCPTCTPGKKCGAGSDCDSHVCDLAATPPVCMPAKCDDNIKNGVETDVDCGGAVCGSTCRSGKRCNGSADCKCLVCTSGFCAPACGDGIICSDVVTETCDDRNAVPDDGCTNCTIDFGYDCGSAAPSVCTTTCGDGKRANNEACDDGNAASNDGCTGCAVDFGYACTGDNPSVCTSTCGDGKRASNESCDDGNAVADDGCTGCAIDFGYSCTGTQPSVCTTTCGDGKRANTEECDDGNVAANDGCTGCVINFAYQCIGNNPSVCTSTCSSICDTLHSTSPSCSTGKCVYTGCSGGWGDCDTSGQNTNGCETPLNTTANCGGCNNACALTNAGSASCNGTTCSYSCNDGFGDCVTTAPNLNGCETQTNTTTNCGGCGRVCDTANSNGATCDGTKCNYTSCKAGRDDCVKTVPNTDGCETSLSSTSSCGGCGNVCDTTHGTATCNGTTCSYSCAGGWADCVASAPNTNGCETQTNTTTNCGACGNVCDTTNSDGATCNGTTCLYTGCKAGFANCATAAPDTNGCETQTNTTLNCGGCGRVCDTANSNGATCNGTTCSYTSCKAGFADCNTTAPNVAGCETPTTTTANCGGCNNACDTTHGSATCNGTTCSYTCSGGWGDCVTAAPNTNGCETQTNTIANCAACGNACDATNSNGATCNGTTCSYASCKLGFADCNTTAPNVAGCETPTNAITNCSGCNLACDTTNSNGATCDGTKCSYTSCKAGFANCNTNAPDTNGCETAANTITNCGGCNNVCDTTNSNGATCDGTKCTYASCKAGFANCDTNVPDTNGCETTISGANCGGCGNICDASHSLGGSCDGTTCQYTGCAAGWADCNTAVPNANGCETATTTIANCGACNNVCDQTHGAAACNGTTCSYACNAGWADCNTATPNINGCETPTTTATDCGGCGIACDTLHSTGASCVGGRCVYVGCAAGWADCDTSGRNTNGCETPTNTVTNCGGCNLACDTINSNGATCNGTTCIYASCKAGFGNCNTTAPDLNGCETPTTTITDCGGCHNACDTTHGAPTCNGTTCSYACSAGWGDCQTAAPNTNGCETPTNTTTNCGGCGNACNPSGHGLASCNGTTCSYACGAGWADCTTTPAPNLIGCDTPTNTTTNCGGCGNLCDTTHGSATCNGTTCSYTCSPGWDDCNKAVPNTNGCETSLSTTTDCAGCGNACNASGHGSATCNGTTCSYSCGAGWGDCTVTAPNLVGCDTQTNTTSNCGACGNVCDTTHGSATCNGTTCSYTCSGGWDDCNKTAPNTNGCETSLSLITSCGGCTNVCDQTHGTATCNGTTCSYTCSGGWGDCVTAVPNTNGCETQTNTTANCGACNNACNTEHATGATCNGTTCSYTCSGGWGDCVTAVPNTNGCETQTNTTSNCAGCNNVCDSTYSNGAACDGTRCTYTSCRSGFGNCVTTAPDTAGCETPTNSIANCSGCNLACDTANSNGAACNGTTCSYTSCKGGYANCNTSAPDTLGCETATNTIANCGGCNNVCDTLQSNGATCNGTTCSYTSCKSGFGNCVTTAPDTLGCETPLNATSNCGGCNNVCNASGHGSPSCNGTTCSYTCNAGWADCITTPAPNLVGCDTNTYSTSNCGACNNVCDTAHSTGAACPAGKCLYSGCSSGYANCDTNAPDTNGCETQTNTTSNCSGCGKVCDVAHASSATCNGTTCSYVCSAGYGDCNSGVAPDIDGCETKLNTLTNCTACGKLCTNPTGHGTTSCDTGACVPTCIAPWADCDGNPFNGCETNTATDVLNCGACGGACDVSHVYAIGTDSLANLASCGGGVCYYNNCKTQWGDCDKSGANRNGCETPLDTTTNCGACGATCTPNHASSGICVQNGAGLGFRCSYTCNPGYGDCTTGGPNADGCESSLTTTTDCGTCGNSCDPTHAAAVCNAAGICSYACSGPWSDCAANGNDPDGCETPLGKQTDCASCGNACLVGRYCSTAPACTVVSQPFATKWTNPTGQRDSSNVLVSMTFNTLSGYPYYYCRTWPLTGTAPAFTPCDKAGGTTAVHRPTFASEGSYRTEFRWQTLPTGGTNTPAFAYDYYVHFSLNAAALCPNMPFTDAQYFAAAAARLSTTAVFGAGGLVKLDNPFIQIPFQNAQASQGMLTSQPDWITPRARLIANGMLSLRHRFVANTPNPSNATLIMRKRMFEHPAAHNCADMLEFQTRWTGHLNYDCPVFVVNANGEGVCLQNTGGSAPFVAFVSVSGWQKIQHHNGNDRTRNDKCTYSGCTRPDYPWMLYLPP